MGLQEIKELVLSDIEVTQSLPGLKIDFYPFVALIKADNQGIRYGRLLHAF
jgi:hypothetical protein